MAFPSPVQSCQLCEINLVASSLHFEILCPVILDVQTIKHGPFVIHHGLLIHFCKQIGNCAVRPVSNSESPRKHAWIVPCLIAS